MNYINKLVNKRFKKCLAMGALATSLAITPLGSYVGLTDVTTAEAKSKIENKKVKLIVKRKDANKKTRTFKSGKTYQEKYSVKLKNGNNKFKGKNFTIIIRQKDNILNVTPKEGIDKYSTFFNSKRTVIKKGTKAKGFKVNYTVDPNVKMKLQEKVTVICTYVLNGKMHVKKKKIKNIRYIIGKNYKKQDDFCGETPVPTTTPGTTETPVPTITPGIIETPVPTITPGTTETPVPTTTPGIIETPVPTITPGTTETPVPTTTPGSIETPVPTITPGTTETPVPTTTPGSIETPVSTTTPGSIETPKPCQHETNSDVITSEGDSEYCCHVYYICDICGEKISLDSNVNKHNFVEYHDQYDWYKECDKCYYTVDLPENLSETNVEEQQIQKFKTLVYKKEEDS